MEALQKLEQVQKIIELMQSHAILGTSDANNAHSHRFLANFILFLMQPCGGIDVSVKCQLISGCMSKISAAFLVDTLQLVDREASHAGHEETTPICCEKVPGPMKIDYEDLAVVGLGSMQRANSTLEDFCRSYFMFHKMDPNHPGSIFEYLPLLSFTESYVYQLDSLNEKLQFPAVGCPISDGHMDMNTTNNCILKSTRMFTNNPFRPLIVLLEKEGVLTERIMEELSSGEEYWALERKLCAALMTKEEISIDDVKRAIHLKSFDYRVLNLILYQLRGEKLF